MTTKHHKLEAHVANAPGSQYDNRNVAELAKELNADLVVPAENHLLVDLDSETAKDLFWRRYSELSGRYPLKVETYKSKSGTHDHAIVTLPMDLPIKERLLLQALMGSDLTREWLSYLRVLDGTPNPSVLFRPRGGPSATVIRQPDSVEDEWPVF